jgi:uncharacterized protein YbjT (DUF2867 family)
MDNHKTPTTPARVPGSETLHHSAGAPVVLAGATGDLGSRVAAELRALGASVRALVRPGIAAEKQTRLSDLGAAVVEVDYADGAALRAAVEGASVVVSALSGLRPVIVDAQSQLLAAAEAAGVPRFIPSDFAIDFTKLPEGSNRNLDLRREFMRVLERSPMRVTSILNGAFTDMLTGVAPFILFGPRKILCWGDPAQKMDWTTIADTARYTAKAALDPDTPRWLRIAGDQISARDLADTMVELTGKRHGIFRPGGPGLLGVLIALTKTFTPASEALYPPWQGMQYMRNMYSGLPKFRAVDNDRYPMVWTSARDVLALHLASASASCPVCRPDGNP